jgi:H+/Cl- antiporter ClcA
MRRCEDRYLSMEEVKILEITINTKQAIAIVWTLIAIALSLIVVLAMDLPYSILGTQYSYNVPWWLMIAAFFGVFLIITLPVYLLIALWGIATKYENE